MGVAINTYNAARLAPQYPNPDYDSIAVALGPSLTLPQGQVLGEKTGNNEVQTLTVTATGGTMTFNFGAAGPSTAVNFNATAAQVLAALVALSTIGVGNVTVTGAGPYVITFQNQLGDFDQAMLVVNVGSLTGGSASFAETTKGSAGTPGVYYPYLSTNTDGTQFPKCFLEYPCATDASGNISIGGAVGVESFGITELVAPAWFTGAFKTSELTGFDDNAKSLMGGHLIQGDVHNGIYAF